MRIVFIVSKDGKEIGSFDCFTFPSLPKKGDIIRLKSKFWEVDCIIFNLDNMEVEIIIKDGY